MRNLKLKGTLKAVLSDWPDKPNQGKYQFLVVDLVVDKYFGFFNWTRTYLTERRKLGVY